MSENPARQAWKIVYQHARTGEILCGHHDYSQKQINAALIGCVLADVLELGEVIRAVANATVGADIPALQVNDQIFVDWPQLWSGTRDEACQKFGSYYGD